MSTAHNKHNTDWLVADSYKLSDDAKTLMNQSVSKNPGGERTVIQVYS